MIDNHREQAPPPQNVKKEKETEKVIFFDVFYLFLI
jgi:hypothetical protein